MTDPKKPAVWRAELMVGRLLLSALFFAGSIQKILDPTPAMMLLEGVGLSGFLVWPAAAFNLVAGILLATGRYVVPVARILAAYCVVTSVFHFIPSDGWQMSIFIKNWAIAGGLLALSAAQSRTIAGRKTAEFHHL